MLKLRSENKATEPADSRDLSGQEIEEIREAEAELEMKKDAYRRTLKFSGDHRTAAAIEASTAVQIARHQLDVTKRRVRSAWEVRQVPMELRY